MTTALDVSAAVAHGIAAYELLVKGRFARSAEKWAKAAQAARALGAPDCLVVATAQIREALALQAAACSEPPERANVLCNRAFTELLPPVMALVERRRCADTLLWFKCAPHEVEWCRQFWKAVDGGGDARVTAAIAQFVGYETYLNAAWVAIYWRGLSCTRDGYAPPTAVQLQQIFSCAETALALMTVPRPEVYKPTGFFFEAELLRAVRGILGDKDEMCGRYRGGLAAALARLEASGIIDERGMEDLQRNTQGRCRVAEATAQADIEERGLRPCAHCGASEVHVAQFKRCSACKAVVFCSKDCQVANWPAYKAACKAARKAAAGAAGGA